MSNTSRQDIPTRAQTAYRSALMTGGDPGVTSRTANPPLCSDCVWPLRRCVGACIGRGSSADACLIILEPREVEVKPSM